jgi:hypothetical protein
MPSEREDEDWARERLSAEMERLDLDLDALVARVVAEVRASTEGQPVRTAGATAGPIPTTSRPVPRLVPVTLAAAAMAAVVILGSVVPGARLWGGDDRQGAAQAEGGMQAPRIPEPTLGPNPPSRSVSAPAMSWPAMSAPATSVPPTGSQPGRTLPAHFRWSASGALIAAKPDAAHDISAIRDPSVVHYQGKWHVFATVAGGAGLNLVYLNFTDWSAAATATQYYLDTSAIGTGYRAAPQVFYFAPQKLWYLVFQTGNASYSTNPDISDPHGWSAPKDFYPDMPDVIRKNIGDGYWVDMWVICDEANCHLFSTDLRGRLYRSQTRVADFPERMSQPVVAVQDTSPENVVSSTNVYKVTGTGHYLLLVAAMTADRHAYLRSWISTDPAGPWKPLAASETNPFAGMRNTTFTGTEWTDEIGQGEIVRDGHDQRLSISPCRLRYLYMGASSKLGLLTQTDATCS